MLKQLSAEIESALTFNPLQDLKRDLHVHFNMSPEVINKMTENEVYDFFDQLEEEEDSEPSETFDFPCDKCAKETKFRSVSFNDHTDCVECKCCECGNMKSISEYFFDSLYDED